MSEGNGTSAVATMVTSAVDPQIAAAIEMKGRLDPLRDALGLGDLTDQEVSLFAMVALHSRLDPFAKQIYAIKRKGKVTFQTGIDGFRSSAEETGEYRGSDEPEYGPMVGTPPHPEWARVVVHRQVPSGDRVRQSATAHWDEYAPTGPEGFQWSRMPRVMLAKCAEAQAFRKAFPRRFGQVYTGEEMEQADAVEQARPVAPTARDAAAARLAAVTTSGADIAVPPGEAASGSMAASPGPDAYVVGEFGPEAVVVPEAAPAPVQCEAFEPEKGRCRKAQGHPNNHQSAEGSWK